MTTNLKIEWKEGKNSYGRPEITADVRFGIFDAKGREMGVELIVELEHEFYLDTAIHGWDTDKNGNKCSKRRYAISSAIQSCRNGMGFGAGFPIRHEQPTVEAAKADCIKRCETSFKKVQRKAATNGGIYK